MERGGRGRVVRLREKTEFVVIPAMVLARLRQMLRRGKPESSLSFLKMAPGPRLKPYRGDECVVEEPKYSSFVPFLVKSIKWEKDQKALA